MGAFGGRQSGREECADEVEKLEPALREAVLCPAADAAVEERRAVLACDAPDVVVRALDAHVLDLQLGASLTHESLPLERRDGVRFRRVVADHHHHRRVAQAEVAHEAEVPAPPRQRGERAGGRRERTTGSQLARCAAG